jgi:branched-chain amino acid transport system ATP-binding protein
MKPLLEVRQLRVSYGKSQILQGLDLQVHAGEILSLLGRNGSGRSTTLKAIMGLTPASGEIDFHEQALADLPGYQRAQRGLAYVPEQREVFPGLTVEQNLLLGEKRSRDGECRWTRADLYALFPSLQARRQVAAGLLSGGEQQMLSLCRSLLGNPDLILIDEPTEGLAPKIVTQIAACLLELKTRGIAVLLVEQKLDIALTIADRIAVLGRGQIVFTGTAGEFALRTDLQQAWLGV